MAYFRIKIRPAITALCLTLAAAVPAYARSIRAYGSYQSNPELVWKQAKERQAKLGGPMVVMVFPTDYRQNQPLAYALQQKKEELSELLGGLTIACLRRDFITKTIKGTDTDHNIWLLDGKGNVLAADLIDMANLKKTDEVAAAIHKMLTVANRKHLLAWADESRKKLGDAKTKALEKAFVDLDAEDFRTRRAAKKLIVSHLPIAAPLILLTRMDTKSIEVRETCREFLIKAGGKAQAKVLGAPTASQNYRGSSRKW